MDDDRYGRSIELFDRLRLNSDNLDSLFLHALEILGTDTDLMSEIKLAKFRIFWKIIKEIANQKLLERRDDNGYLSTEISSTMMVLSAFPDKKKRKDGRMWLPMCLAVTVPDVALTDIQTLFKAEPKTISNICVINRPCGLYDGSYPFDKLTVSPCHLTTMTKNPNMALIKLLKMYDRNFGSLLDCNDSSPLHLAAEFSNSLALIQELIQMNPMALGLRNRDGDTPLLCVAANEYPEAPNILKALIQADPQTVVGTNIGGLLLHKFLNGNQYVTTKDMILIILEAFPEAINTPDTDGRLPIHVATVQCSVEILRIITEANPDNLSTVIRNQISVAHCAVSGRKFENIGYIHSIMPDLFLAMDDKQQTPLHFFVEDNYYPYPIKRLVSLVPETARHVDINGENLLHALFKNRNPGKEESLIRLFLRLIPGGALVTNNQGQTPYDLLDPDNTDNNYVRRLLLLAGAPSLHPETRKQMNYQARKGALLAFFAGVFEPNIFYRIREARDGIVLMRQVVSFL